MRREKLALVFGYAALVPAWIWLAYKDPMGIFASICIGGLITFIVNRFFIFK